MKCTYCGNQRTRVIDSRSVEDGGAIRRRRHCETCGKRFTTFERRERVQVYVLKRSGPREAYSRQKLAGGMYKACSKRGVPAAEIEAALDDIEGELAKLPGREISASDLGEMVMVRLKRIDEVAYMRFASVYKRFGNVSEFQKELGELMPGERERTGAPGEERSIE